MSSNELIWQLVKNNNSFLVKRNGVQFSRERYVLDREHLSLFLTFSYNLRNRNSFKYSGLANNSAVDISSAEGNKVAFNLKKSGVLAQNQPASQPTNGVLAKDYRRGAKAVKSSLSTYRPDLTADALARFNQLKKATTRPASGPAKKQRRRNAKQ